MASAEERGRRVAPPAEICVNNRRSPLYDLHVYPSKKPHQALRQLIEHFTDPGDVVLDPMCGAGGTAFAARSLGRQAVAYDLSPLAIWLTRQLVEPSSASDLRVGLERLEAEFDAQFQELYATTCDGCGGQARARYFIHSTRFQCAQCGHSQLLKQGQHGCERCGAKLGQALPVGDTEPVGLRYECLSGCRPKLASRGPGDRAFQADLALWRATEALPIPKSVPRARFPMGKETARLHKAGISDLSQLFTERALEVLGRLKAGIEALPEAQRRPLLLAFSGNLLGCTRMCTLSNGNTLRGTYYVPPVQRENNVWNLFLGKAESVARALKLAEQELAGQPLALLAQADARDLSQLADESVDYVLTDPPYADSVQYSELNFLFEAWLGLPVDWDKSELVVNRFQGKHLEDWQKGLTAALAECRRVLKPGRWLSLCYQNSRWDALWALQEAVRQAGFAFMGGAPTRVVVGQRSYNQINTGKPNKHDLVFHFCKTEEALPRPVAATPEEIRQLVQQLEAERPAASRSWLWDQVTGGLLQAGRLPEEDFSQLVLAP